MLQRVLGNAARVGRSVERRVAGAITCVALAATLTALPAGAQAKDEPPVSDITMVQANIYTGLTVPRFQADVSTVLSLSPDFVTYNEVPFRQDAVLAPEGYGIYRNMRNRFTAATPVAWRTDRWQPIDQGSYRISNWRGVPPGRQVELGRRFANWVTLLGTDGRTVSVVSIHVAPAVKGMPDLRRRSVRHLGDLVEKLSPRGPVLVGGDFNVHYTSGLYPRDLFAASGLVPTYDTLGGYFPTGDHQGATIDYVLNRGADQLLADKHYPVELKSDHDAVVAGFSWLVDAPAETQVVVSRPRGDLADRRAALDALIGAIKSAKPGGVVEVATTRLDLFGLSRQLRRALDRGVHVRFSTSGDQPTRWERRLARDVAASGDADSWFRRCGDTCRDSWRQKGVPRGFMMVSDSRGVWKTKLVSNHKFSEVLLNKVTRVEISTGEHALAQGEALLRSLG